MLQEAFIDAEKLIEANTAATRMTWQTRQTRLEANWDGFMLKVFCGIRPVELDQCVVCCLDCGSGVLFCSECDMQAHD